MPFLSNSPQETYALLPDGDHESLEFDENPKHGGTTSNGCSNRGSSSCRSSALKWVLSLLVVVAVTDGVALFFMSRIMNNVYADLSTADLEFANPYHGLDALYRSGTINSSHIDPILNVPRLSAQLYPNDPKKLAPVGEHDYWHKAFGTLSPHEKHLQVSPEVSTFVQFRALDFGMEACELVIRLPGPGDPIESKETPQWSELTVLDIAMLDAQKPTDIKTLSYASRPPPKKGEKVRTVAPVPGKEITVGRFPCKWGTLHTFEVACSESAGSGCLVDVWSSQNTTYGIYMYQHQTI